MFRNRELVECVDSCVFPELSLSLKEAMLITGATFPSSSEDWHWCPDLVIGPGEHTCRSLDFLTLNLGLVLVIKL